MNTVTFKQANIKFDDLREAVGRSDCISESTEVIKDHSHAWWPINSAWRHQGKSPFEPNAVATPKDPEEVAKILSWAQKAKVPVTPWGLGSSVVGGPLAGQGVISLDTT